jgi:hypothetical protein
MNSYSTRDRSADAARIVLNDLGAMIRIARHARTAETKAYALKEYRNCLIEYDELCERAAISGWNDPVFQPQLPIPIRDQLVGLSPEARRALEWKPWPNH